jgi:hypothetical protein
VPSLPVAGRCFPVALLLALIAGLLLFPRAAGAQEADTTVTAPGLPYVFLDCARCDHTYIRRELTLVNYVRERQEAQIHILVTDLPTGSGGREYDIHLIGQGVFAGHNHRLTYTSDGTDTPDEVRQGFVRTLRIGLVPFLMQTPIVRRMSLLVEGEGAAQVVVDRDPWNGWIFEVYASGFGNREASRTSFSARYGIFADRVTEQWKLRFRPYGNYAFDRFEQRDRVIRSESIRDGLDTYVIRSLGPHWSVGAFADAFRSTFANIKLRLRAAPGVEFSVFPYREASRRRLTAAYIGGISEVAYRDTTIYDQIRETLPYHALNVNYDVTQPWGGIDVGLEALQYLSQPDKYRFEFDAGISVRVLRGLSVRTSANVELIHDQLNLPRGDASLEEILLRRRQLATTYEVSASLGFTYTFGSLYTNVVNTRF